MWIFLNLNFKYKRSSVKNWYFFMWEKLMSESQVKISSPVFNKKEYWVLNCEITNGATLLRKILHNCSTIDNIVYVYK